MNEYELRHAARQRFRQKVGKRELPEAELRALAQQAFREVLQEHRVQAAQKAKEQRVADIASEEFDRLMGVKRADPFGCPSLASRTPSSPWDDP